ncbi:MAG TPA: ASKHA domain-containing protein, partial [Verrucomicrobiae bacterium]|nr:ASKHA domain-containing protein [Verrucomicrobiae bacterium]
MTAEPLVVFTPSGRRGRFEAGTTVLDAARRLGVDIDSVCGGRGICGRCQVEQSVGEFAKHGITSAPDHLTPFGSVEAEYRDLKGLAHERRLSCMAHIRGDVVIDVPPESQVYRQVVRKGLDVRDFHLDPVVRLHYVEVEPPQLASPSGDLHRLQVSLEREWQLTDLEADLHVIRALQPALEAGKYGVTVAVHDRKTITGIWPGLHEQVYGVAIDVGSTTIAGHLANLGDGSVLASAGVMNPQIRFGEDLMSRVSYAMMNDAGATEMTAAVRTSLNGLLAQLANRAGIKRDAILELSLVGNPIMHHLVLGIDPIPLGSAPFALATDRAVTIRADELGLVTHPGARVYVLPCIAGHVGADTAGVILAEAPHESEVVELVVDVGTNAEIVLGNKYFLLAASSPTGPAFEGAQISSGQRAAPGAIERVRIDRATLEPRFRVIGSELWSDDPGFAAATADTGITGICGSGIVEVIAELFLAGVVTPDGIVDGSLAARSPRIVAEGRTFSYVLHDGSGSGRLRISVTQNDVRAIQLAKAALYAGVRLLMDHAGIDAVEDVRLAGAFGSQIDPFHAMVLGLIPDAPLDRVKAAGNAAGTGALIAL